MSNSILFTDGAFAATNSIGASCVVAIPASTDRLLHVSTDVFCAKTPSFCEAYSIFVAAAYAPLRAVIVNDSRIVIDGFSGDTGVKASSPTEAALIKTTQDLLNEKNIKLIWMPRKSNICLQICDDIARTTVTNLNNCGNVISQDFVDIEPYKIKQVYNQIEKLL